MQWFINDLSLDGQFSDSLAFRGAIEPLLRLRAASRAVREGLFCSRRLSMRRATPVADFATAIRGQRDPNLTNLVLVWLTKQGPFWDDERQPNEEDYFEHQGLDVTDQGMGEAARRRLAGVDSGVFSFLGSPLPFDRSPLEILQGLPDEPPLASVEVDNLWTVDALKAFAEASEGEPRSWEALLARAGERFPGLILSGEIADFLAPYPFSVCVARRVFELLGVLERIVAETDEAGALSPEGQLLYGNHFVGAKKVGSPTSRPPTESPSSGR